MVNSNGNGKKLVVLFHGFTGKGDTGKRSNFSDVINLVKANYPDAEIHAPTLPYSVAISKVRAAAIVAHQIKEISCLVKDKEISEIVLIGYSMGAVIMRRVLIEASDIPKSRPTGGLDNSEFGFSSYVEPELIDIKPQSWINKISRVVLIAGMGRGWSIDNAKGLLQNFLWSAGSLYGHLTPFAKPTVFDMRKGAPFIVQTRLRWLKFIEQNSHQRNHIEVIQMLGTVDENVSPNDTVDFAKGPNGDHIRLVEVPNSGHKEIVVLNSGKGKGKMLTPEACKLRSEILRAAIAGDKKILERHTIPRHFLEDELPSDPDRSVDNLVFVIHGIRDRGYWTKKIASRIKAAAERTGTSFISRTPTYGYFAILPFLLPWIRRQKVEWLMDHYVETRAIYPDAEFHYMGHSNGTFLCASSLLNYPEVSFNRIMFAGSVVRPDFPWRDLVENGRVEKVYNAIATGDWVVAIFPNGLRWLKNYFQLGGAGHCGFDDNGLESELFQLDYGSGIEKTRKFVTGDHSAAREESQWDEIANFIVDGSTPKSENVDYSSTQSKVLLFLGKISPIILSVIALLLFSVFLGLFLPIIFDMFPSLVSGAEYYSAPENLWQHISNIWYTWVNQSFVVHLMALVAYVYSVRILALKF